MTATLEATLAQRRAADPAASAWVAASAGSGKTKVLTDRVLNLLLQGTAPQRILCLTFTRAAAAEMSIRLADRLRHWATQSDAKVEASLRDLGGGPPEPPTVAAARQLFARVLDAPGGVKIQTIHAFCQALLGRFPAEAGVPPHFELIEERGEADLIAAAREAVLRAARAGDATVAGALAEAIRHTQESGFGEVLGEVLKQRGKLRLLLKDAGGHEDACRRLAAALDADAESSPESCIEAACREDVLDGAALRSAAAALLAGTAAEQKRGRALADWLDAEPVARPQLFERWSGIFLTDKGTVRKLFANKATQTGNPGIAAALEKEAERILACVERIRACRLFHASAALLRLGAAVLDAYGREKRRRAALDFGDLIAHARTLLQRPGIAPWILFKLDGGIDHILIDESQDTNFEQWDIVKALADEFFSGSGARAHGRTIFAVGDEKQSIFRFQGADPAAFRTMRDHFAARIEAARANTGVEAAILPRFDEIPLDISFRSTAAVLRAVDAVFGAGGPGFDGVEARQHTSSREGQAGLVELWPLVPCPKAPDPEPWALPVEREPPPIPRQRLAKALARQIRAWIAGGEILPARGRALRAGDFMVLVRRRNAFVADLVRELRQHEVPVSGLDRMELARQLVVEDLVALAQFLLLPEDDLTLATVLKGPLFGFDDDDLFRLCHNRKRRLWEELMRRRADAPRWDEAASTLQELLARADFTPPYELFADVLSTRRGRQKFLERLGPEAGDALDELLSLALRYERANVPSLQGFLHWLEAGNLELKRELDQSGRDEVRIMTVHGAKGLQAPIVILADTTSAPARHEALRWTADGLLLWCPHNECDAPAARQAKRDFETERDREYRRLLYVAMTRAEDRLYVVGHAGGKAEPAHCWYRVAEAALRPVAAETAFDLSALCGAEGWSGTALRYGTEQEAEPREKAPVAAPDIAALALPVWATRPPPPEPTPPRPLSPSQPLGPEPPARSPLEGGTQAAQGVRRGLLVHRLLQALPALAPAGREAAGRRYLARPVHGLARDEQDAILRETLAVLAAPDFAPLFGPDSLAEVPIVGLIGTHAVAGQIDRLVVTRDEVLIVDYKTLRPPPATEAEIPEAYLRQLALYGAAVEEIWPDRPVRAALLFTDGPFLMPVSHAALAGRAP